MDILIKGGRLLDPVNERDGLYDLWIRDGKIWKVKEQNMDKEEPDASGPKATQGIKSAVAPLLSSPLLANLRSTARVYLAMAMELSPAE